jgi:hypothetical protein
MGKPRDTFVRVGTQNMRGLQRDEHVEEFMLWFKKLGLWAACLQETWRLGNTLEQHNDVVIINTGQSTNCVDVAHLAWLSF